MPQQDQTTGRGGVRGLLMERRGPLPVWGWVAIVLGVLLGVLWWRRGRAAADATTATTGSDTSNWSAVGTPGPFFIVPQQTPPTIIVNPPAVPGSGTGTVPPAPPGGGRPGPPTSPPPIGTPVPSPPGLMVRVDTYTNKNPPWNSTLWGIWSHLNGPSPTFQTTAGSWQDIWNHPLNAQLRQLRGRPENIRKDDKVFVPGRMK